MTRIALIAVALAASTTAAGAYDYSRGDRIDEKLFRAYDRGGHRCKP